MAQSKSKETKNKAVTKKKVVTKKKATIAAKASAAKSKAPAAKSKVPVKKKVVSKAKGVAKRAAAPIKKVATPAATQKPAAVAAQQPVAPPKPKQPSKRPKLLFKAGDYVVYPTHGVGLVQGVEKEVIGGQKLELVVVTFDNDRMTLRVPMEKMDTSGLRELSNRKTMDNAMTTLKGRARVKRTMWSRRAQEYEAKINSGDPTSIAEVVRDLHRNVGQPDQSFSERQIYESALERLAGEVAAVDDTDKEKALEKLEQTLQSST